MSQPRFAHKRIGYLAACQWFNNSTDVVLLTTNLLKKEFQSQNQYEVGLAINCLANIVNRDLARDLLQARAPSRARRAPIDRVVTRPASGCRAAYVAHQAVCAQEGRVGHVQTLHALSARVAPHL